MRRRAILEYAVAFDLVVIAVGVGLLIPPQSGLLLAPFIVAIGAATWRGGWKVGLATTFFSLVALLLAFESIPPLAQLLVFALIGVTTSLILDSVNAAVSLQPADLSASELADAAQIANLTDEIRRRALPALLYVGLPVLVLVIYLNVSHILVDNFGIPSILQPLVLVLAGLVLHYRDFFRPEATIARPLTMALLGYCLVVFASSNWARDVSVADSELTDLLKSVILLIVAASLAASWQALRGAMIALAAGALLLSIIALVQVAIGDPSLEFGGLAGVQEGHIYGEYKELRPAGPVGDPNYFARILVLAVPAAAFLGIARSSRIERIGYWTAAAVIALAILFTYSRGGMLTLAAVAGLAAIAWRIRITWKTVATASLLLVVLLPTAVGQRLLTIGALFGDDGTTTVDASVEKRQQLLAVGWRIFSDHPVLGVGAGNFGSHYPAYANVVGLNSTDFTPMGVRQYAHNLYLEMATETGLLGLLAFIGSMAVALVMLYRSRKKLLERGEVAHAALVTALALAIAGYLISSVFLQHTGVHRYLWLILGFAVAAGKLTDEAAGDGESTVAQLNARGNVSSSSLPG